MHRNPPHSKAKLHSADCAAPKLKWQAKTQPSYAANTSLRMVVFTRRTVMIIRTKGNASFAIDAFPFVQHILWHWKKR